mgnify:CR=1
MTRQLTNGTSVSNASQVDDRSDTGYGVAEDSFRKSGEREDDGQLVKSQYEKITDKQAAWWETKYFGNTLHPRNW